MNSSYSLFNSTTTRPTRSPKVGDVLFGSFGYEACLPHWFKVVKVSGASVGIQSLETTRQYKDNIGGMYWTETPKDSPVGPVKTKRFKLMENGYRVKESSVMNLYLGSMESCEGYNVH